MCRRVVSFWDSSSVFCWHLQSWSCPEPLSVVCVLWGSTWSRWERQIPYSWLQCDFSYQGKNFSPVYARPVPSLPFFVVVKTGCVRCSWRNVVADSHGIRAGRASEPEGDPGEASLGCASVLCRCPSAHSDTLWEAQHGPEVTEQPERICSKICRHSHATRACRSVEPADRLPVLSVPWISACWPQPGAFVLLPE